MTMTMNFRSALSIAIVVASATATRPFARPGSELSASSALGSKLLSKARRLGQNDDAYDFTWAADYSIVFHSCHNTLEFRADGGGASGDQDGVPTETNGMVLFKLCPSDRCSAGCRGGGEYLVEMREFVQSYTESREQALEDACEQVKENCSCDDDDAVNDDEVCLSRCYAAAGLDGCEEDDGDDDWDFDVDRYMECEAIDEYDDDYRESLYVGAYCSSNGKNVYLGAFQDRQCTQRASKGAYESRMGRELPYASESLIGDGCISCMDAQDDGDDDGVEVLELCEELYERSAKCERHLNVDQKVTGGCEFIHKILPRMEALADGKVPKSTVFAWLFGITTLAATGAALFFFTKAQRADVQLSSQGDGNFA